jgi:1,4-dihydroxy-6-naphthoate synthase
MRITLGYSPCPNDTFIFGALANGLIDTQGIELDIVLDDVEALNKMAAAAQLDVTKLSYHAFAHLTDTYQLLNSGSALGNGCGPLLVARKPMEADEIGRARIAIPGKMTTANFLLSLAYPHATHKTEVLFSDIEDGVVSGKYDAGLIIHENRFTYQQKGLVCLRDLGDFWEGATGEPIPLGGIVAKRSLGTPLQKKMEALIRESLAFAYQNTAAIMPYIRQHAQAMDDAVMQSHIDLYVNDYSLDLGERGRGAVHRMFDMAKEKQLVPHIAADFLLV